jgi:hypothetical protein
LTDVYIRQLLNLRKSNEKVLKELQHPETQKTLHEEDQRNTLDPLILQIFIDVPTTSTKEIYLNTDGVPIYFYGWCPPKRLREPLIRKIITQNITKTLKNIDITPPEETQILKAIRTVRRINWPGIGFDVTHALEVWRRIDYPQLVQTAQQTQDNKQTKQTSSKEKYNRTQEFKKQRDEWRRQNN